MALRRIHALAAWLFIAAILAQVYLAGSAIANLGGSGDFSTHVSFGYSGVPIAWIILLVTALAARRPRGELAWVFLLFGIYVVQTILPGAKGSAPWIAALHPVNALLLFGVAAGYARRAWRAG